MNRDDIIRMAREASCGWTHNGTEPLLTGESQIQRFAALVAAEKDKEIQELRNELAARHKAFDAMANNVVKYIYKYHAMEAEMETYKREVAVLQKALDAALDFAGTVGGSSSWWEEIWAEHEAAIDAARGEK